MLCPNGQGLIGVSWKVLFDLIQIKAGQSQKDGDDATRTIIGHVVALHVQIKTAARLANPDSAPLPVQFLLPRLIPR